MSWTRSAGQRMGSTMDRVRSAIDHVRRAQQQPALRGNSDQPQAQPAQRATGYSMRDTFEAGPARAPTPTPVRSDDLSLPHAHGGHGDSAVPAAGAGGTEPSAAGVAHAVNAAAARAIGQDIVARNSAQGIDTSGVYRELQSFVDEPSHSQAERGAVVASALQALPADHGRAVATALVDGTRPERLDTISRAGIESLQASLGTDEATSAQRGVLAAELARRGPVQERIVNDVRIVGDEVSAEAMDAAAAQVGVLTSANPDVAEAMRGTTVVVTPHGENGTDQDLVFESIGIHAQRTPDGRLWDSVGGGAAGKFLYVNERDLVVNGRAGPQATTNHEFSHAVQYAYVNSLPANDPRLTALLDPGTSVSDTNGDGRLTGADVMKLAWEQRRDSGRLSDSYSGVNQNEWFAQAGSSYAGANRRVADPVNAQWLYNNDRPLFNLLQSLYGATPQRVNQNGGGGGGGGRPPFWANWF